MNRNTDENNRIDVNQMTWAIIRRHVKIFLDTTWIIGSQYIIFRDSSLEKLLRQRCLKNDVNEIRALHAFMAEFYRKYSSMKDVSTSRVLYHYEQGHMYQELVNYLHSLEGRIVTRHDRENYLRVRIFISISYFFSLFDIFKAPSLYKHTWFCEHQR